MVQAKKKNSTLWAPIVIQGTADAKDFQAQATMYSATRFLHMKYSELDLARVWFAKQQAIWEAWLACIESVLSLDVEEVLKA